MQDGAILFRIVSGPYVDVALAALIGISLNTGPTNAQQYKMQTPVPPGVAIPDKVETRFGALNFFGGFPYKASVDKLYDNLDFQRAAQAYLLAPPKSPTATTFCKSDPLTRPCRFGRRWSTSRPLSSLPTTTRLTLGFGWTSVPSRDWLELKVA
jgi:hypothetical protein